MAQIYHQFTSPKADGPDATLVRPSDWNAAHVANIPEGVLIQGNTSGVTGLISTGTLYLVGGNNITLSQNGQSIEIIGASQSTHTHSFLSAGMSTGGNTAGTTGLVAQQLVFFGGNNITLSQSVNGQSATLSLIGPNTHAEQTGISAIVAGGVTQSSGTVIFSNSNNFTFGLNAGTLTASFSQSTHDHTFLSAGMSTQGATSGTTGLVAGQLVFVGQGLVGLSQSVNGQSGTLSFYGWGLSAGMSTQGNTAGTTGLVPLQLVIVGGNNVTLSQSVDGAAATLTINGAAGGAGGVAISAGTQLATSGTVVFVNSNNITFGMSNSSQITASFSESTHAHPFVAVAASNSTLTSGTAVFTGSNNITLSYNGQTIIVSGANTHAQQTGISGIAASNSTITSGTAIFTGSNNITLSYNGQTIIVSGPNTHAQQTGISAIIASNSTYTSGTLQLSGSNNITVSYNASTILISGPNPFNLIGAGANGTATFTNSVSFFAGNNITLSTGANAVSIHGGAGGGGVGLVVNGANGTATFTSGTITIAGGNNITLSTGADAWSIHGEAGGGGGYTKSIKFLHEDFIGFNASSGTSSEGTQYMFSPLHMDSPISISNIWMVKSMTATTGSSSNSSGRQSFSYAHSLWIFKRVDFGANSASLTYYTSGSVGVSASRSHTSNSNSFSIAWVTNSLGGTSSSSTTGTGSVWVSAVSGLRILAIPLVTSMSAGEWFICHRHSSTTATVNSNATLLSIYALAWSLQTGVGYVYGGIFANTNSQLSNPFHGIGFGSASAITTNAAMPASVISAGGTLKMQHGVMVNMGVK